MATSDKLDGLERATEQTLGQSPNGAVLAEPAEYDGGGLLRSYWILLGLRHRRLLIWSGLCSMALIFVLTNFVMHTKYRAEAVIRPVSQSGNGLSGLLQSTGLGMGNGLVGVGLDSDLGNNIHDPEELKSILQSYAFTIAMINEEQLGPKLLKGARSLWGFLPGHHRPPTMWNLYRLMSNKFDCDFSVRTGNMTLYFVDKEPEQAQAILGLYIDRLRAQLRARDVRDIGVAAKSLQEEAGGTSDPLLRDDLYDLTARQIKKVRTAEANADFAFAVIEPPYVPPLRYRPMVGLDTVAAGLLIPLIIYAVLVIRDRAPEIRQDFAAAASASRPRTEGSRSVHEIGAPGAEEGRPGML